MTGTLTIARDNHGGISLYVEDATSDTRFLTLECSPEALALALTGQSSQPCTFTLRAQHIGKHRETKQERVQCALVYGEYAMLAKQKALAPFEIEGWHGDPSDLGNHHRGNVQEGYLVTFTRFVEMPRASGDNVE